jgi:hypothetical protein
MRPAILELLDQGGCAHSRSSTISGRVNALYTCSLGIVGMRPLIAPGKLTHHACMGAQFSPAKLPVIC